MRVAINAMFWNQPATGSGQYVRRLTAALAEWEPDLELLLVAPRGVTIHRPPARAETCCTGRAVTGGMAKLYYEQSAYVRAGRRARADVLHVPYFAPPRWSSRPVIVTIHDLIPMLLPEYRGSALVRAYTAWVAWASHAARVVLTDSQASARDIVQHLRIPEERVQVVPLAADETYRPAPPESDVELAAVRERLALPGRYLLYLGGFDRRKQVPELIQAYRRSGLAPEWPLVIAGRLPTHGSELFPDPRAVAESFGVEHSVILTGWIEEADKPALYRGARAFVFPSQYEGFGLPVLEALSCGTPAIVCGGSSLDEVAGPGGLSVPVDDIAALAGAMRSLAEDNALRATLAERGLAHAAAYSWSATAHATARAYRQVSRG